MFRYLSPTLFFAAAAYVHWHNENDGASVWTLPLMDTIWPETRGHIFAQGEKTVIVLIALGVVLTFLQAIKDWRYRQQLRAHLQEPRA